jgi:hypothetical protein
LFRKSAGIPFIDKPTFFLREVVKVPAGAAESLPEVLPFFAPFA